MLKSFGGVLKDKRYPLKVSLTEVIKAVLVGVCALGNIHRQGRLLKRGPHLPGVMKNPRCGALNTSPA